MFDGLMSRKKDRSHQSRSASEKSSPVPDIPTIIEPSKSTDSTTTSSHRPRWPSVSNIADKDKLSATSTPNETWTQTRSRGRSQSTASTDAAATRNKTKSKDKRKRNIFWKSSLWDVGSAQPRGSRIRASSQSVSVMHPEMAEEKMRAMPHYHWRGDSDWRSGYVV